MALGTTTALAIGLGAAGLGSYMNARQGNKAARAQGAYGQEQAEWLRSLMGAGPSAAEGWGMNFLNNGQDGTMQSLRSDPAAKSQQTLEGIVAAGGNPFDVSKMFEQLGMVDRRGLEEALATGRSTAPGLGQRFGSAQMRADADTRVRATESMGARNAGIAMGSYEAGQGRVMQALSQLGQMGQFNKGMEAQIFQALLGAEASRRGQNLGMAGMASQVGAPVTEPGYGQVFGDIGSLLAMMAMMGPGGQQAATPTTPAGPWAMGGYRVPTYTPSVTTVPPNLRRF